MLSIKRVGLQEGPSSSHFWVLLWKSIYATDNNSVSVSVPAWQGLFLECWYTHTHKLQSMHVYIKLFKKAHQGEIFSNKHFGFFFLLKENTLSS